MARLGSIGTQYFDDNGDPLSGGLMYFYESGTTDAKTTYSDEALAVANPNPVVLDAAGRQPNIFFYGTARCILKTSAGVQVEDRDPVGNAISNAEFSAWNANASYDENDIVRASDDRYHMSVINTNTGNDPTSTTGYWMEVRLNNVYSSAYTYSSGAIVIASDKNLYISLVDSNVGNSPLTSPAEWRNVTSTMEMVTTPKTANFTASRGKHYLIDTSGGAFTVTLPASPYASDVVSFSDYGQSFDTYNLTVGRNTYKIMGLSEDMTVDQKNISFALLYSGTTKGWVLV